MIRPVGILGCGWLGLPLGTALLDKGYPVLGTTTDANKMPLLKKYGIKPFLIRISESRIEGPIQDFMAEIDTLIVTIPPGRVRTSVSAYSERIAVFLSAIGLGTVRRCVFASSTSVYGSIVGTVDETTDPRPISIGSRDLFAAENLFRNSGLQVTVVRFGGLIGPDRHPVTHLSGKSGLANGNDPVNLIHLNDAIGISTSILEKQWWDETLNGVYPYHPPKAEYYTAEALARGLVPPKYLPTAEITGKIVVSKRLEAKGYRFTTAVDWPNRIGHTLLG